MNTKQKRDASISLSKASLLAIVLGIPLLAVAVPPFILLWGREAASISHIDNLSYITVPFGILLHELLHGLTWQALSGKWGDVKYGFKWQMLTPYAHLKRPIAVWQYRIGCWMPGLIVGLLPLLYGLATGQSGWFWYGVLFTWSAAGDAMVLWLIRNVPGHAIVEDHPARAGCYIYDETARPTMTV